MNNPLPSDFVDAAQRACIGALRDENTALKAKLRESSALLVEAQGQFKRDSETIERLAKELKFSKALNEGYRMTIREMIQLVEGADKPTLTQPKTSNEIQDN